MESKTVDLLILGAGLSGLAAAHHLRRLDPKRELMLLERSSRLGGSIRSLNQEGWQAEWGPHGFLDNVPASMDLIEQLGLAPLVERAPLGRFERYLCRNGELVALPQHPKEALKSPLVSPWGKLRALGDLLTPPSKDEQSVAQWASRRFGRAVLPLVDAALTGTYAGDMERLSIDAVMPRLRQMELEHSSVLRALKRRAKNAEGSRQLPQMVSFRGGIQQLTDRLGENLPIEFNREVAEIVPGPKGYTVIAEGLKVHCRELVVALPANKAVGLLAPLLLPPGPPPPEAKLVNLVLGFGPEAQVPQGFGYLAPRAERRFALGCLFSSRMFPSRAPNGGLLLECLIGGRLYPEHLELSDKQLTAKALADLRQLMDLPEKPQFAQVLRPSQGIPQPEMGHPALLDWRNQLMEKYPRLAVFGFGWDGIGINDMTRGAQAVAEYLVHQKATPGPRFKGVYF